MKRTLRHAACLALLCLQACVVGPTYQRPQVDTPAAYRRAASDEATEAASRESIADLAWWRVFNDPQLMALVNEALRDNLDLAIAASQIMEAQAQLAVARSALFPQLSGQANATRGNDNATFTTGNSFFAALALSWEIDFWGRYRRATEAARASLLATEEGRSGVVVSLVSSVAQQYLQLAGLRQRLEVVQHTVQAQRDSLRLVKLLSRQGVQSAAEERQAESDLLATESQIPGLQRQIAQAENALAILLGKPPRSFDTAADFPAFAMPPEVPAGVPSDLLTRRPDIRQSEQQLIAANANVGVARAQFFPSISLTGTLGRVSDTLHGLASGKGQSVAAAGVAASVPLFNAGAVAGNYHIAQARAEQAVLQYRRTVLVALQEVSDALIAHQRDREEALANRARVSVTMESLRLANLRYRSGVISYLEVLDAQRQLFSAELDLTAAELNQRLAAVQLYKVLGGGWSAAQ